jgi:hypothetical protein
MWKTEMVPREVVIDVICDRCQKSTTYEEECGPDYATLDAHWGFGSSRDGDKVELHLCDTCCGVVEAFIRKGGHANET